MKPPKMEQPVTPEVAQSRLAGREGDLITVFPSGRPPFTGTLSGTRIASVRSTRRGSALALTLDLS